MSSIDAVKLPPVVPSLFEGEIVDHSANTRELAKRVSLKGRGVQSVAKTSLDHFKILTPNSTGGNGHELERITH